MNVKIDINQNLKEQFKRCFNLNDELHLDPAVGTGGPMKHLVFPGQMELYHFQAAKFAVPVAMKTLNPVDSEWFLVHINLSAVKQRKVIADQAIDFQKSLPIGMLIYGPGLEIDTLIPQDVDTEVVSIRFSQQFLSTYFEDWHQTFVIGKSLILEDLDYRMEGELHKALNSMDDKIHCHAVVLAFLGHLFKKLSTHDKAIAYEKLRPREIEGLFRACAHLRAPLATDVPSLGELAALANMGQTKFKSVFRQVFGSAPMQYRNKVRMEYAREQIASNRKTPTEISYLLGYSHPSNFTAAYKKQFGDVPSAERR